MNSTRKTFYALGVVSAALNILGGVVLLFGTQASLLFHLASVAAGAMMLLAATSLQAEPRRRNFCLVGALLTILGMAPGLPGIVGGAASWPVFAWPHFRAAAPESLLRRAASLVLLCGAVLLAGSFLPVPRMLAACIILAVAAAQGLLALLLYRGEDAGGA